jgi:hypothetical protein
MRFNEIVEAWSEKYKRSIDCSKPRGFSQRAHCAGRKKRGIKEFAPDSGGGRWYSDSEMMDIVGKGWDTSTDSNLFAEQLIMDAQDWLDKMGYDVRVIDVKRYNREVYWYIEGRLFKNRDRLSEISVAQRRRQRKASSSMKRQDELDRETNKLASKSNDKLIRKVKPKKAVSKSDEVGGIFSDPMFDKYKVDTSIDTSFEGGYYLYFHVTLDGIYLYWGRNVENFEQAEVYKQFKHMGRNFNAREFQQVIDYIVAKTSRGGEPGYCSIVIPKKFLTHSYIQGAYSYLMNRYPQDDPTMNASVYWELV